MNTSAPSPYAAFFFTSFHRDKEVKIGTGISSRAALPTDTIRGYANYRAGIPTEIHDIVETLLARDNSDNTVEYRGKKYSDLAAFARKNAQFFELFTLKDEFIVAEFDELNADIDY